MADGDPMVDVADVEVIAPHLKRRLSGVTSTVVQLIPVQARDLGIVVLGPGLPKGLPRLRRGTWPALWRAPRARPRRIWHARRNVEMATGVVLARLLRMPFGLVFTSAAQRRHKPFTKWLIRRMDAVIATSGRSGSFLDVPHTVVMHGIDTQAFRPRGPGDDAGLPADLQGQRLVGCSGRVRHQKGTDLFIDAMIALLPGHPEWSAVVTGRVTADNARFAEVLRSRIAEAGLAGRILFLGEVPDIRALYRHLSLFVAPSRNEGFGLTPLEAMASGVPVVASDAGAYAEMIVGDVTGKVVPAGDGRALQEAIRAYLDDPDLAQRHGQAALVHVRAAFALQKEADGIRRVYEQVWRR